MRQSLAGAAFGNTVGMTDNIMLIGFVATVPKHFITGEGLPITTFRLASTQRRFDRAQGRWADGETNWYSVTTFRQLAINAVASVKKGDRVIVSGRLRIRGWEAGDKSGTSIDVEADAVGHDLSWGTTVFTRSIVTAPVAASGEHGDSAQADSPAADQAQSDSSGPDSSESGSGVVSDEGSFPSAATLEAADADSVAVPF